MTVSSLCQPRLRPVASLHLLGDFELAYAHVGIEISVNGARLLALLGLSDRPVRREHVAGLLWPEVSNGHGSGSLRSTLWRLPRPEGTSLVQASKTHVALDSGIEVDVRLAEQQARAILARRSDSATTGPERWLQTDVLCEWWDEWIVAARERFRQLRLYALEALSQQHREAGRFPAAMMTALAAVESEPLRESAHRRVVEVHLADGNAVEALRHYEGYRRELRRRTGLLPSAAMQELVRPLGRQAG